MPVARIGSTALWGIEAHPVVVEVDVCPGLPVVITVGLPDSAVRESRVRIKSAIQNSGFEFPSRRVAVNLAPADLPKQGTGLDLPIALAILAASGQLPELDPRQLWALGELSLEGRVCDVAGVLPALVAARQHRTRRLLVPASCSVSAGLVTGVEIWGIDSLPVCVEALRSQRRPEMASPGAAYAGSISRRAAAELDLAEVRGQAHARRALEIAAAGGHALLMVGPPGAGKTMLARRLPTVLPLLTAEEAIEVSCVYSVADPSRLRHGAIVEPPFRAPHHSISLPALIGGGADPRPGEISLAHRGVLFLDELTEFRPGVLEALRQPLEEGEARVSRSRRTVHFPARCALVAAMNPCPCGYRGDPVRPCVCAPAALRRQERILSGPLLERIDLQVEMPRPDPVSWEAPSEASAPVRQRVERARERMRKRSSSAGRLNAHLGVAAVTRARRVGVEAGRLLDAAVSRFALSPRVRHRILKVAFTLADLEGSEQVREHHVAEAVQYRTRGQR
ncbi:MAG: YifB family Mg chelatase-like AAA ATPase [Acidobacteriota bacterium]